MNALFHQTRMLIIGAAMVLGGLVMADVVAVIALGAEDRPQPPVLRALLISNPRPHGLTVADKVLIETLEKTGRFKVDFEPNVPALCQNPQRLAGYDVLINNWTDYGSWRDYHKAQKAAQEGKGPPAVTPPGWPAPFRKAFLDFLAAGKGHVAIHHGIDSHHDWPEFERMLGLVWRHGQSGHASINIEFEVRFTEARHPITAGLPAFKMRDELYHRQELQPGAIVLAEAYSLADPPRNYGTGKWEPALVVQEFGGGRSASLVFGHDQVGASQPGFKTLFTRAVEWAATGRVTLPP